MLTRLQPGRPPAVSGFGVTVHCGALIPVNHSVCARSLSMKLPVRFLLVFTVALAMVAGVRAADEKLAAAAVRTTVTFEEPENFSDFREGVLTTAKDLEALQREFTNHLLRLSRLYVAEGQKLEIHFLDIDLAGDFEPWRGPSYDRVRVVKDIYPPRITVLFRLTAADGTIVAEGRRELRNLSFLHSINLPTSDSLRHDKELLTLWLRREFKRLASNS